MNVLTSTSDSPVTEDTADNRHYLRAVTDMAQRCAVVAQDAIYTDNGIKLVDKGARVDSRFYERLLQHKLREPIDQQLSVADAVSVPALVEAARELCATDALAQLLARSLGGAGRLVAPLRSVPLPPPMAFKLTVMREQRPELLAHSLRMMLMAVFLGVQSGWSERECVPLAAAALLHDIGVLHMDPLWRDPEHKVTGERRKHLVAHPVTAMVMIRAQQVYPRSVETAVLEHHERMDGTGYPRSLAGEQISPMGRILLVAEVAAAFFEKYQAAPMRRLSLALRLNHHKFPADLTALLLRLQREPPEPEPPAAPGADAMSRHIGVLSSAFRLWEERRAALSALWLNPASGRACAYVDSRVTALQRTLYDAGFQPRQQDEMLRHLEGDGAGLQELGLLSREAVWQLQSILNACHSRWPRLAERADAGDAAVADWIDACAAELAGL